MAISSERAPEAFTSHHATATMTKASGLLDDSLRGSSPQPFLYKMDLNGDESISLVSGLIPWPRLLRTYRQ
jgi:hypothetical protein